MQAALAGQVTGPLLRLALRMMGLGALVDGSSMIGTQTLKFSNSRFLRLYSGTPERVCAVFD